jgi:Domain of unknown function (DUF5060)/Putative collagen-binding domain of a collagenase
VAGVVGFILFCLMNSPAVALEQVGLYDVREMRLSNSQNYGNPFDFTVIELQATFTAASGRQVKFFGFHDGDGHGGQTGNVWKLRFMPDELGTWHYAYSWTDGTAGGSGSFEVVDTGRPGPLQIATDNPWYFMTARGEPFHARPYAMQDFGPRMGISSWESIAPDYIEVLRNKVIAGGYNMVMASGPNRFGEGRSYWWKNQPDVFDVGVWNEYEKVLGYALANQLYFFPFDGMAEQSGISRVTKVFKRYMIARYGAFASYMGYSPTWEWTDMWSEAGLNTFMQELRDWNPFPTLLSAHDSSRPSFTTWMGFSMRHHQARTIFAGNCRPCSRHGGIQEPFDNLPIMGSEDVWENPQGSDRHPRNAEEIRRGVWGMMLAGVLPVYSEWYWTFSRGNGAGEPEVRRMFDFVYGQTRYRQYRQLNHLLSVLMGARPVRWLYGDMSRLPRPLQRIDIRLVSRSARQIASGIPGQEYLVYDEDGGSITLDLSSTSPTVTFSVLWFDPKTGSEQDGDRVAGGGSRTLTSPVAGDSILLLRRVPQ